ncbi:hypothetical protein TRAPUB_10750 [Trametes pubescens]|uniref:Uncharacterized protein n=1 Tax=Trametes pubescens TaxID=154538 RepID=A0A1M2VYY5_TRAPU|nr:hypothetical protein TRAPUB_10750 [Trametes pubescens]
MAVTRELSASGPPRPVQSRSPDTRPSGRNEVVAADATRWGTCSSLIALPNHGARDARPHQPRPVSQARGPQRGPRSSRPAQRVPFFPILVCGSSPSCIYAGPEPLDNSYSLTPSDLKNCACDRDRACDSDPDSDLETLQRPRPRPSTVSPTFDYIPDSHPRPRPASAPPRPFPDGVRDSPNRASLCMWHPPPKAPNSVLPSPSWPGAISSLSPPCVPAALVGNSGSYSILLASYKSPFGSRPLGPSTPTS